MNPEAQSPVPSQSDVPVTPLVSTRSLKNKRTLVPDSAKALDICKTAEWAARVQIRKTAKVQRVIDGGPPFSPAMLRDQSEAWRQNINTGVLVSICQEVASRLWRRLRTVKYLTAASLPITKEFPNAAEKTELYRRVFSESVRSWLQWNVFLQGLCTEVCYYGFAFPTFPERWSWKPEMLRVDEAFVPQGTKILSQDMAYYVVREDWDVMDFLEKIQDKEMAEAQGWDIQNCVNSINNASPKPRDQNMLETDTRRWQDIIRDLVPSDSWEKAWNLVQVYRLWVREEGGWVTEWILDRKSGAQLFKDDRPMLRMQDIVLPMCFQYGNGTVYGSKGAGVQLYERAVMVERERNRASDNLTMRSRIPLQAAPGADVTKAKLEVMATHTIISGAQVVAQGANALSDITDSSMKLDEYWMRMMKQDVGAWLPIEPMDTAEKTATQAKIDAIQRTEVNSFIIESMLTQFQLLTGMIARRMFNPLSPDRLAQQARARLLQNGLSEQEITYLATRPPVDNVVDFDAELEQMKAEWLMANRGNTFYDQSKLEKQLAVIKLGAHLADDLIMPAPDQTMTAENASKQLLENPQLVQGVGMPVSPRDNHEMHMAVIQGQQNPQSGEWANDIVGAAAQGNLQGATNLLAHYTTHFEAARAAKMLGEQGNNQAKAFIAAMNQAIINAHKAIQERQQAAQKGGLAALPAA